MMIFVDQLLQVLFNLFELITFSAPIDIECPIESLPRRTLHEVRGIVAQLSQCLGDQTETAGNRWRTGGRQFEETGIHGNPW